MSGNNDNSDKIGELIDRVRDLGADEQLRVLEAIGAGRIPNPPEIPEESEEEGDQPSPPPSRADCDCFCRVLRCLTDEEVFGEFYARHDIDLEAFRDCIDEMCRVCFDFRAYNVGQTVNYPFNYRGFGFDVVHPGDRPGSYGSTDAFRDPTGDGIADLPFPERGQRIDTPTVSRVEVHLISGTLEEIVLQAFDGTGMVDRARVSGQTVHHSPETLTVQARRITHLIINGGGNEGYITRICYTR